MTSRQYTQKGAKTPWISCHIIPHHVKKGKEHWPKNMCLPSSKCSSQCHDPGWNPASDNTRRDTPVCVLAHSKPTVEQAKRPCNWAWGGSQDRITDVQASERRTDCKWRVSCHSQEQSCYDPNCVAWKGDLNSSWRTPGTCEDQAIAEKESLVPKDWSTCEEKDKNFPSMSSKQHRQLSQTTSNVSTSPQPMVHGAHWFGGHFLLESIYSWLSTHTPGSQRSA